MWLILTALLLSATAAGAQTITGTITGIVKDSSGGVLPGVTIPMTQIETNRVETAVSDAEGRWCSLLRIRACLTLPNASIDM